MTLTPCQRSEALTAIDVNDSQMGDQERERLLGALIGVHARHFPDYPYVTDRLVAQAEPQDTVAHAWLLCVNGRPAGEFLFHTCLRRGIAQLHYVALDPAGSAQLPLGWLADVTDTALATSVTEAAAQGVELLGMAGEMFSTPRDYRRWRRKGFLILAMDYREPVAGRDWRFRPNDFRGLTIGLRLTEAGKTADPELVLDAVLSAFLLDYYGLPADHPEVVRMFAEAARLGLRELPDEVING